MALDLDDGVAQRAAVRVGERGTREEYSLSEADFVARVEEGEIHRHARVHGFCGAEEETEDYHAVFSLQC